MTKRMLYGLGLLGILINLSTVEPVTASGPKKTIVFTVEGFTCRGCADDLRAKVEKFEGVEAVEVSFEKQYVKVTFDAAETTAEAIQKAIAEKTRYRVTLNNEQEPGVGQSAKHTG